MSRAPLLTITESSPAEHRRFDAIFLGAGGIGALAVLIGLFSSAGALTIIGFAIIVIAIMLYTISRRNLSDEEKQAAIEKSEKDISQFRTDLIDTMYGYDLPYTHEEIEYEVMKYRALREEEDASLVDITPDIIISTCDNIKNDVEKHIYKKKMKSADKKKKTADSRSAGFLNDGE